MAGPLDGDSGQGKANVAHDLTNVQDLVGGCAGLLRQRNPHLNTGLIVLFPLSDPPVRCDRCPLKVHITRPQPANRRDPPAQALDEVEE